MKKWLFLVLFFVPVWINAQEKMAFVNETALVDSCMATFGFDAEMAMMEKIYEKKLKEYEEMKKDPNASGHVLKVLDGDLVEYRARIEQLKSYAPSEEEVQQQRASHVASIRERARKKCKKLKYSDYVDISLFKGENYTEADDITLKIWEDIKDGK